MANRYTTEQFIKKAQKIHINPDGTPKYDYSITKYIHSEDYIEYICPIHGKQKQKASEHLKKHGCKQCAINLMKIKNSLTNEEFISRCQKIHINPDGTPKYDYSITKYINTQYQIEYICPIHGKQVQFADNHLRGRGCKKCANKQNSLTNEEFISRCQKIHINPDGTPKYDYSITKFKKSLDTIEYICPIHGKQKQLATNHLHNREGCPYCSHHVSSNEILLQNFLINQNIKFETSNRKIIYPKELDIYIPEKQIGIEINGLNFHSDKFKSNNYHLQKTIECEKQGIHLIHIFEDEWLYKHKIIEARLLNLLGKNKFSIGARKLILKQVPVEQERIFLNNNHLQGYIASQVCYGLYYKTKDNRELLVCLMSFGQLRKNLGSSAQDSVYELYRFVTAKGYSVPGGASRLFKHFIKQFKPKQVISYADRRWSIKSERNLYEQLGFKFDSFTEPNYFYVQGNKRINRFNLRKDILIKEYGCLSTQTEKEFTEQMGWPRIYDCGNLKYIWNN